MGRGSILRAGIATGRSQPPPPRARMAGKEKRPGGARRREEGGEPAHRHPTSILAPASVGYTRRMAHLCAGGQKEAPPEGRMINLP